MSVIILLTMSGIISVTMNVIGLLSIREKKPYTRASKQMVLFVNIMVKLLEISKLTQAGLKELVHIFKIGILRIMIELYSDQETLTVVLRLLIPKTVR